jgi:hypothetical protein
MPSHLHYIVRQTDAKLNYVIRDFKSFTAKHILQEIENGIGESRKEWLLHVFQYHAKYQKQNLKYQFWQKTNYPIELDTNKFIDQKVDYIHNNPLKAGLVTDAEYYVYSSANPFSPLEMDEL